ncbi:MAG: hypothetical protein RIN55_00530 [Tissierellaceae bacterium]|nr:hypothetical protein [Tissierellaceae bacterium]
MKTKYLFILLVILTISIILTACNEIQHLPVVVDLENSIKEIISSKGENYDFLNDKQYMSKMHELVSLFVDNNLIKEEHYVLGNLNNDNIPELVVFRERDPNNVEDQGALEVYEYNIGKYSLIDRIPMNYDNTNYELVIGKIGPNQNGILLNNQVGSQSGITYGFIFSKGNLVSILNENKVNLVSIDTKNEIKDIDKDNILEFSIYTIDPESTDQSIKNSDKIMYWYKWNGSDGVELVKFENIRNKDNKKEKSDNKVLKEAERLFSIDRLSYLNYLKNNKKSLSIQDSTKLVERYFDKMLEESSAKGVVINNLFSRYQLGNSNDYLFNKYGLSLERLNDIAYLSRDKVLNAESELKNNLIHNLKLGYKLKEKDGKYSYTINYQAFLDNIGDNILKEYRDYYKILALDTNTQYMKNDTLLITLDKLAERIILIDNFSMTYPYSKFIENLIPIYNDYLNILLYGSKNSPVFDKESNLINKEILVQYKEIKEKYANTNLSDILTNYLKELESNGNAITVDIKKNFNEKYLK